MFSFQEICLLNISSFEGGALTPAVVPALAVAPPQPPVDTTPIIV